MTQNKEELPPEASQPNCHILVGEKVKDLRLSQKNVGNKQKTVFDKDWGWCFYRKQDAEKVAEKHSRAGSEIKVIPFFSEVARRKWHGTKLEKKATSLLTCAIF